MTGSNKVFILTLQNWGVIHSFAGQNGHQQQPKLQRRPNAN